MGKSDAMFDGEFDGNLFNGKLGGDARMAVPREERPFTLFFFRKRKEENRKYFRRVFGGDRREHFSMVRFDGEGRW